MNRRDAITRVGLILGGTVIGAELFLSGCSNRTELATTETYFSSDTVAFLDEVGETILPTTSTSPGAKAAKIGTFMGVIVTDCYEAKDQETFMEGISKLNDAAEALFNKNFMGLSTDEKHSLLIKLDQEAKEHDASKKEGESSHYFSMMKQLTLWGYFTSEIGSTKALRYEPLPGSYDGCMSYQQGDKAWAAI